NNREDDLRTQLSITAVLERLQRIETRLAGDIDGLATRLRSDMDAMAARLTADMGALAERMDGQIQTLRGEMEAGFRSLAAKIQVLNDDTLNVRAHQREILERISQLEAKAS